MKLRRVTSLTGLLCFVGMLITSVVHYIEPQGRVAYWSDWRLWGLTKKQWGEVHLNLGVLFLLAAALHLYYNWSAIVHYLKDRARNLKVFTGDFNLALGLVVFVVVGTVAGIPPLKWIPEGSEFFKNRAEERYGVPPYGHAELSSLREFARKTGLDPEECLRRLRAHGYVVESPQRTLQEIARLNGVSPQELYEAMKSAVPSERPQRALPSDPPAGIGRKSLRELSETYGVSLERMLDLLKKEGIAAEPEDTLKSLGDAHGRHPRELYRVIQKAGAA